MQTPCPLVLYRIPEPVAAPVGQLPSPVADPARGRQRPCRRRPAPCVCPACSPVFCPRPLGPGLPWSGQRHPSGSRAFGVSLEGLGRRGRRACAPLCSGCSNATQDAPALRPRTPMARGNEGPKPVYRAFCRPEQKARRSGRL